MSYAIIMSDNDGSIVCTGHLEEKATAIQIASIMNTLSNIMENWAHVYYVVSLPKKTRKSIDDLLYGLFKDEPEVLALLRKTPRLSRLVCVKRLLKRVSDAETV